MHFPSRCCSDLWSRSGLSRFILCLAIGCGGLSSLALAQNLAVPRRHDRPPGPPLSPAEAVAKMTVPEGFSVEVVASEPDVMNPVAMFIDEKGRYWITESFEYPRREPGPGRDRIKVLEDTDGDGKVDKVTVFAEGLNIPSGIAVGYGGVWVANSPDILFLQDTDGDLKADKQEVIVTGFGRTDTHELPNSFTWGPDGWLYGLNGVFNYCDVKYAETNPNFKPDHPGWKFTCAMWRIHPRTREFQIFAEGTSNPWGIAINDEGDFFISACVIDHLWHIVETGYYIRQGGPYPPHTWPSRSIVDHKHQKAAYCGITWFDSDVYPEEYRRVLYMGNIHGGCINADVIERSGSTYKGNPHPGFTAKPRAWKDDEFGTIAKTGDPANPKLADFLTANDPWFMPVVQTTGPDGCLYILDWYDRYHCYQDANADPAGIERERGRLYRVRYKDTPHAQPFDLGRKSDDELIALLDGPNEYVRSTARRLLAERANPQTQQTLIRRVLDKTLSTGFRLQALWAAAGIAAVDRNGLSELLRGADRRTGSETPRPLLAWSLRLLGEQQQFDSQVIGTSQYAHDASVHLQTIIAATKAPAHNRGLPTEVVCFVLRAHPQDQFLHQIGWQTIRSLLSEQPENVAAMLVQHVVVERDETPGAIEIYGRAVDFLYDHARGADDLVSLIQQSCRTAAPVSLQRRVLSTAARRLREDGPEHPRQAALRAKLQADVLQLTNSPDAGIADLSTTIAALWGDETAQRTLQNVFTDTGAPTPRRVEALRSLIAAGATRGLPESLQRVFDSPGNNLEFQSGVVDSLSALRDQSTSVAAAGILVERLPQWDERLKPRVIEVLTQRPAPSRLLLTAIQSGRINRDALNLNQLRRIATFKDESVQALLKELYGAIREGRDPEREQVVNKTRDFLNGTPGDPVKGEAIFKKVCAQCHKLHGEGAEVGPDLTRNGRNSWDQLLVNMLDPSQVIGPGYQARILVTDDGRTLTGLPVEESDTQVVLKVQGGKLETIPRDQIEVYKVSELSMMPDQLEKQVTPQELADLMSFLAHDRHPRDPEAKLLPGAPNPTR